MLHYGLEKVNGSQTDMSVEFDETSSSSVVYQRRNIIQIKVTNQDDTTITLWSMKRELSLQVKLTLKRIILS